jgi:RNA recognition motif-containing protein
MSRNPINEEDAAISARIFVGNLSFGTTAETLTQLLSEVGSVLQVYLPTDRETGRPRGFAFVEFATDAHAADAIRLFNVREVDGRRVTVNAAEDRPARRERSDSTPRRGVPFKRKGSRRGVRGRKRSL